MSIVKNNTSYQDSSVTIKALSKITDQNMDWDIYKYVRLVNSGYQSYYLSNSGLYFMMRCELPENANGYLMGIKASSSQNATNTFYIKIENKVITWVIGTTSYTHAWEEGVHDIGWVDGKPLYDNELVSTTAVAMSGVHGNKMVICGVRIDSNTYEYISQIDLYRVNMMVYASVNPTASSISYLECFYPCPSTLRNSMKIPEARMVVTYNSGTTNSATASEETVTYGVQLDDLRYITGSGYRDLMAIECEDNTLAAESWADAEDRITNDDETHKMAFRLADGTGVQASDVVPLPATFRLTRPSGGYKSDLDYRYYIGSGSVTDPNNYSGFLPYKKGDLIYGRKPTWPLWADGITWGRYVEGRRVMKADVNEIFQNLYFLRFNIFKDYKGDDLQELLERWDGFNTGAVHAPSAEVLSGLYLEFHNRISCLCDVSTALTGKNAGSTTASSADDRAIFKYSLSSSVLAKVKAGNLAPWDVPRAQQTGNFGWIVRGLTIDYIYDNGNNKYVIAHASAYGSESDGNGGIATFAKESTTDKTAFRDNGVQIENAEFDHSLSESMFGIFAVDYNGIRTSVSQATLHTYVKMGLLQNQPSEEITEMGTIHLDYILPKVGEEDIVCANDPVSFKPGTSTTKSRFLAGEYGGLAKVNGSDYEIQIFRSGSNAYSESVDWNTDFRYKLTSSTFFQLRKCIGFEFALKEKDSDTLLDLSTSANEVICFMDYNYVGVATQNNVEYNVALGRRVAFTTAERPRVGSESTAPCWQEPFAAEDPNMSKWLVGASLGTTDHVYPSGISVTGSNVNNLRTAVFRWKDLLRSGSSDYNDWKRPTNNSNVAHPSTARLRIFQKTDGPVAWDIDIQNLNNGIDAISGQQFVQFQKSGSYYRFYFLNSDRIMQKRGFATETLLSCTFTAWKQQSAGVWKRYNDGGSGNVDYNIGGINVYIDEIPLHDAHEEAEVTTVAQFTNVQPGASLDYGNFHLSMSQAHYNADFAWLPGGTSNYEDLGENGSGLKGFFDIKVTIDQHPELWHSGSLYVLRFNETTTYNHQHYDGTTA